MNITTGKRFDIQFLRGVAVLLVVLFHAFRRDVGHGFLGVDLFFVVSGFLITGIVLADLERGSFSFRGFYLRRAKRLLPAAYATFIGATLIGYVLLTSDEWRDYLTQLVGALTYSANIVLSQQGGYFAAPSATKPLLHIWSLSLEEQFYFVMPVCLWLISARFRLPVLLAGALLSLVACIAIVSFTGFETLAFYLLPTRAWELLAGALAAYLTLHRPAFAVSRAIQWASLIVIVLVCLIGFDSDHPRFDALLVVIATTLILLGHDVWLPVNFLTRPIATIGDWSYSLYLVHWPLFAFATIAYVGDPPAAVLAVLAGLSLFLAWIQYRFVELPFHYGWKVRGTRAWVAFAAVTVTVLAVAAPAVAALKPRIAELVPNTGLSPTCDQQEAKWIRLAQCQRGISPTVAVWGDSYAEQLVGGVPANVSVVQITKSACAPIPGIAQVTDVYGETFARRCAAFNQNVLQNLMSDPSIRQVVISSPFAQVLANEGQKLIVDGKVQPWSELLAAQRLTAALIALRIAGKEPIIVAPTPRAEFDPGQCNVRKVVGLPVLGRSDCALPRSAFTPDYVSTLDQLRRIAISTGVALYIPEDVLCGRTVCFTRIGNMIVFRDGEGHLTRSASKYLLSTFGLAEKLNTIRPANF